MAVTRIHEQSPPDDGERPRGPNAVFDTLSRSVVRVLLVEDDASMRAAVRLVLQQCSAGVTAFASAQNGYELIAEIRSAERTHGTSPIPAVALSAYAREADRTRAVTAGFHQHVAKPIDPAGMIDAVASLVGRFAKPRVR